MPPKRTLLLCLFSLLMAWSISRLTAFSATGSATAPLILIVPQQPQAHPTVFLMQGGKVTGPTNDPQGFQWFSPAQVNDSSSLYPLAKAPPGTQLYLGVTL